ncbi:MAG: tRNA 2-selenouridine(34) synthase MnmH [Proteobacteria bacterium]|nr:tRNA 2-selenouridine(34) synthase MnmH [Pseudomonadota bacterium]
MSTELEDLFINEIPLIDVRAPVEFLAGHLPHAVNLPLMSDEERHLVGICYKEQGQEKAIELGHQLVSGENKNKKIQAWIEFLQKNPSAEVMCLRGGLRSQISCQWITEAGIARKPIPGGYKRLRQFLLSQLEEKPLPKLVRLGGMTGTGKTDLLKTLDHYIDIEELAHHRGSAFGDHGQQPSQASFESALGAKLIGMKQAVVEDESIRLGNVRIPNRFYLHMQETPLVMLEVPLEERVANIYRDYVKNNDQSFFRERVQRISKKLGGQRTREILEQMQGAFQGAPSIEAHSAWISQLLGEYYDPAYEFSLAKHKEKIVFRGGADEVRDFLLKLQL